MQDAFVTTNLIAIDTSASMAAQDVPPTRLEAVKKTAIDLVDNLKSKSQIGGECVI